ncbi:MAG: stage 0 sporulation family protein [Nitrospirae bacterium]|nr:stage 0 sporulation family protein [Nitrospirota bacterium]
MIKIVGVKFRDKGKIYHFDPTNLDLKIGDAVVVETERGMGYAKISSLPRFIQQFPSGRQLKKVLKMAGEEDIAAMQKNKEKEIEAFKFCLERIKERELPMKLVDVEFMQDSSKITFYFTADNRIDFRELVKDIAGKYKTRIEMRQIGVRDEARMINGFGPCGRQLCCSAFLRDFEPVSIKMAKEQSMVLNPAKISGICGRLMCCIGYEAGNGEPCKKAPRPEAEEIAAETEEIISETPLPIEEKEQVPQQAEMETAMPSEHREAVKPESKPIEQVKEAVRVETQQQPEKPSQPQAQKPASFREKRRRRRHRKRHRH